MRSAVILAGMALMVLGAIAGLVVGAQVRACGHTLEAAAIRGDVGAYNAAVPLCQGLLQQRSLAFGAVIVGALMVAAPTGYDVLARRPRRDP